MGSFSTFPTCSRCFRLVPMMWVGPTLTQWDFFWGGKFSLFCIKLSEKLGKTWFFFFSVKCFFPEKIFLYTFLAIFRFPKIDNFLMQKQKIYIEKHAFTSSIFPPKIPKEWKFATKKITGWHQCFHFWWILHLGDWKKLKTKEANVIGTSKTFFGIKKWPKVTKVTTLHVYSSSDPSTNPSLHKSLCGHFFWSPSK